MKYSIGDSLAGGFASMVIVTEAYLSFSFQMVSYNDYVACNPATGISRLEWLFGARPFEDCRR